MVNIRSPWGMSSSLCNVSISTKFPWYLWFHYALRTMYHITPYRPTLRMSKTSGNLFTFQFEALKYIPTAELCMSLAVHKYCLSGSYKTIMIITLLRNEWMNKLHNTQFSKRDISARLGVTHCSSVSSEIIVTIAFLLMDSYYIMFVTTFISKFHTSRIVFHPKSSSIINTSKQILCKKCQFLWFVCCICNFLMSF